MTKPPTFDELLPRMQHAFFETVWPAFRWVRSIWIKQSGGQFHVFVEATAPQNEKERDDFDYLAGKVFKAVERFINELAPNSKHTVEHTIQYGVAAPQDGGYRELMSERVFKRIAKRHAPWRLEEGR